MVGAGDRHRVGRHADDLEVDEPAADPRGARGAALPARVRAPRAGPRPRLSRLHRRPARADHRGCPSADLSPSRGRHGTAAPGARLRVPGVGAGAPALRRGGGGGVRAADGDCRSARLRAARAHPLGRERRDGGVVRGHVFAGRGVDRTRAHRVHRLDHARLLHPQQHRRLVPVLRRRAVRGSRHACSSSLTTARSRERWPAISRSAACRPRSSRSSRRIRRSN